MELIQAILEQNGCYKQGKRIKVHGLMLHSVGCPQPSAEAFLKSWNNEQKKVCVHAFIDGGSGKIYQTLPWDYKGWHCGGNGNNSHIGVEMCEPACIRYTDGVSFTCTDIQAAFEVAKKTYEAAVELFAFLCGQYHLDPLADGVIVSHKEGHARGIASGHADPEHLWRGLGTGYTMDEFRREVHAAMQNAAPQSSSAESAAMKETASGQADGIFPGDTVSLSPDAVYYSGKSMPGWVKRAQWIVKAVKDDRAVIDKCTNGMNAINSPVNIRYLTVVSRSGKPQEQAEPEPQAQSQTMEQPQAEPEPQAQTQPQPGPGGGEWDVSDRGVALIAKYEGCRLQAYKCPAGMWTIGYGHTAGVKEGDTLPDDAEAKRLLKEDLKKYGGYVNRCIKNGVITFAMTQNMFDALTSFTYNCGNGNLQKLVQDRDAATVAEKMLCYNKGGGKVLSGLAKRREEERSMFLNG